MAKFHKFMYCDHSQPNGLGSQVMRMTRIENLDKWSVGLLALMKTKAEERALYANAQYCEEDLFNEDPYEDCLCDVCIQTTIDNYELSRLSMNRAFKAWKKRRLIIKRHALKEDNNA